MSFYYIFSWCRRTDSLFSISTLFNFTSSAVVLCSVGFCFMYSHEVAEITRYAFCLVVCVLQIVHLCWLGDCIMVYVRYIFYNCRGKIILKDIFRVHTLVIVHTTVNGTMEVCHTKEALCSLYTEVKKSKC